MSSAIQGPEACWRFRRFVITVSESLVLFSIQPFNTCITLKRGRAKRCANLTINLLPFHPLSFLFFSITFYLLHKDTYCYILDSSVLKTICFDEMGWASTWTLSLLQFSRPVICKSHCLQCLLTIPCEIIFLVIDTDYYPCTSDGKAAHIFSPENTQNEDGHASSVPLSIMLGGAS